MSAASDYTEAGVLNHLLNGVALASPANVWVALSTTPITDAGSITEPVGNGYARAQVLGGSSRFTVVSGAGTATLAQALEYLMATGSWGTITHAAVMDAPTGGNMIVHGALTTARSPVSGEIPRFAPGSIVFTMA